MVNLKNLVIIHQLKKELEEVEKELKTQLLADPANACHKDVAKITISEKTRTEYSPEDKKLIDEYMKSIGHNKVVTSTWQEVRFSKISGEVNQSIQGWLADTLTNTNDTNIKQVVNTLLKSI